MALTVAELKTELFKLGSTYDDKYIVVYLVDSGGKEFSVVDVEIDDDNNDVLLNIEAPETDP